MPVQRQPVSNKLVDARECAPKLRFALVDLTDENFRAACGQHGDRIRMLSVPDIISLESP
jgi:hypothetical protein